MTSQEAKSTSSPGCSGWLFVGHKQKAVGLITLCSNHADEALKFSNVSMRRIQEGWSDLGDGIVLALRQHAALGENKCARCNAKDWASVEIWYGFKPEARAQLERAAGLRPPAWVGSRNT